MTQTYRALRVARSDGGVLSVVIDASPMGYSHNPVIRGISA